MADWSTGGFYFLSGYEFISLDRPSAAGGVGIFLCSSFNYFIGHDLCCMLHYIKCLFIELPKNGKQNIIMGCIYRPSNTKSNADTNLFNSELKSILISIDNSKKKTILLAGDYNLDQLDSDDQYVSDFINNLLAYSYLPAITRPTRITQNFKTLLDNIYIYFLIALTCS